MIRIFSLVFLFFYINVCSTSESGTNLYDEMGIQLSYNDLFNLHHAFVVERSKWKSGIVSFKIDRFFSSAETAIIIDAMYMVEIASCIRFVAHDPSHGPNYVLIMKVDAKRCNSDVGCRNQGEQYLRLGVGCTESIQVVIHELLHTIGFSHHHSRSDRDQYVNIYLDNVYEDQTFNFHRPMFFDQRIKYVTPFDFNSIMLYREHEFSKNNKSVMTSKVEGAKIEPTQISISRYDRVLLNHFYNCYSVDTKRSKIFYESQFGIEFPPIINYHEIARAAKYLIVYENEKNQKPDEDLPDQHTKNETERVTESELVRNESAIVIGQNERSEDLVDDEDNKNYEIEENEKTGEELPDQDSINEIVRDENTKVIGRNERPEDLVDDEDNKNYEIEENQKTGEELPDQDSINEIVRDGSAIVIDQNERSEDLVDDEGNKNYETEENKKTDEELDDQNSINERERVTESELVRDNITTVFGQEYEESESIIFLVPHYVNRKLPRRSNNG